MKKKHYKVLYFTTLKETNDTNMSQWQIAHFISEMRFKGWIFDLYYPYESNSFEEANNKLIEHVRKTKPDFLISIFNEKNISPMTLRRISDFGVPTVLICFDNLVIPFEHKNIAKYYDLVWLTSKETEYLFKKWGASTIFLPYAASPFFVSENRTKNYEYKMVFVGTPYGSRSVLLQRIIDNSISIDVYGTPKGNNKVDYSVLSSNKRQLINLCSFPIGRRLLKGSIKYHYLSKRMPLNGDNLNIFDPVYVNEVPGLYEKYALCLSSTSARNTEVLKRNVPIVNLRSFEIPMAYGIQICRYNKELSYYFDEDKEILFYRNDDELKEKAAFYTDIKNYNSIHRMKQAAHRRAFAQHTWEKRFIRIVNKLGI